MTIGVGIGLPIYADGTSGSTNTHTIMHLTSDQLAQMQKDYYATPKYPATGLTAAQAVPKGSLSLLSYLPYVPSQRNQGSCGNCFVWGTTGAIEIDHNVNFGISNRLSTQYFDDNYGLGPTQHLDSACGGGWPATVTSLYNTLQKVIPWSNTNAYWGDGNDPENQPYGPTTPPLSAISTNPFYPLNSYSLTTITTQGVSQSTAINNIKSALNAHKAVIWCFMMNDDGWNGPNGFYNFWRNDASTAIFDPSPYMVDNQNGGHCVDIVGYDDTNPSAPYWLVVNSWGAPSNRPDGTFRLNMNMNYNAYSDHPSYNWFQTISSNYVTPVITKISPSTGSANGGNSVTITGSGFIELSSVQFGTTPASIVYSPNQITATAPAHAAGTVDITVHAFGGTSPVVAADQYTYIAAPTVTSVSPNSGPLAGGNTVTINGANLYGTTNVYFGKTLATNVKVVARCLYNPILKECIPLYPLQYYVTATAPAGTAGVVDVTVKTPGGISATSAADQYTYEAPPTVTSISPNSGSTAGGVNVTINGANLFGTTAVTIGGNPATNVVVQWQPPIIFNKIIIRLGYYYVTATVPAGSAGTVDTTVTTPSGTSASSAADGFTYVALPTVTSVSPNSGSKAGGTVVTITGTGFNGVTGIMFGTTPAFSVSESLTANNQKLTSTGTQITIVSPPHAAGVVNVTVTNLGGTSATSTADQFTYK